MLEFGLVLLSVALFLESYLLMDLYNRVRRIQKAAAAVLQEDQ